MSFTNIETEALVVAKPGEHFQLTPIILDQVRGNEVLVEMKYSGICHTVSVCARVNVCVNVCVCVCRAQDNDWAKVVTRHTKAWPGRATM